MKKIFLGIFTSSLLLLGFSSAADLSAYTFEGFDHTYNFSSTTDTVSCLYTTPDGLHVFMCSQDRHTIESYDLTSPWDTTTMSYVSSTDVNYSSQALAGMSFASGGTKLYVSWVNGTIGQYDLSTPYDLSTISLVTTSDISAQASNIGGLFTKANGTKLYVLNYGDSTIYQYSLSTPYDLSTLSYDSVSYNVNTAIGAMYPGFSDISFSKNGTTLYVTDSVYSSSIYAFTLSTAWDITTASLTTSRNVATEDYRPSALSISSSGDHMLMIGSFNNTLYTYTGTTTVDDFTFVNHNHTNVSCLYVAPDGSNAFLCARDVHAIDKYGFSNPWDITTLGYVSSHGADYGDQGLEGVSVVDSGNKLYTLWSSGAVGQYDLSTPNDLSTLSLVNTFDISSELTDAGGLFMKEDGTKLYVVGRTNNTVYQYSLSTPYDLSTLSYDATSYDASYVGMTNSHAIFFNSDGTKFYIADNAGDSTLFEFDLTTPWDISTASSTSDLISLDGQAYWPSALSFNGSGESVLMSEAFNNILNALTGTGH